jgi:hypothetical protein
MLRSRYDHWKTRSPDDEMFQEFEPPDDEAPELPDVITIYDPPAIPIRNYDWTAYRDGQEEAGPYGYGATRQEALTDLFNLEEDGF